MKNLLYLSLAILMVSLSCSVEKRLHNSGYHITWKKRNVSNEKNDFITKSNTENTNNEDNLVLANSNETNSEEIENEPFVIINSSNSNHAFSYTSSEKIEIPTDLSSTKIKELKKLSKSHSKKINNIKIKSVNDLFTPENLLIMGLILLLLILIILLLSFLSSPFGLILSLLLSVVIAYLVLKLLGLV